MSSKIKLLLIEDNPADIRLIQEMLLEINDTDIDGNTFDTSTAETLSSGLEQSIKSEFDVIILDLSLPDSHGIDTFNKIHLQLLQKPIIILSGLDDTKLAIEAVHNGAQDYLVKGHVDSHLLVRAIRYAIARNKTEIEKNHIQTQLFQAHKMEAIGILAGGVAHDFNNLMTAIQGFSDVMIMKTDETNPSYRALKQIRNAASSAADLTRQMLFFSRKQHMEYVTLNINKVIENMLKILHRLTGEDIGISVVTDSNISMMKADRGTLEQVIMNLVFNAKDAMPEGGRITIKTGNQKLTENQLSVADTGIGMDEKTLQRIFEPFYSTKGPNKGTGLGLSVVYGIIKEHQGWIYAESNPDKGTIFHLYFPTQRKFKGSDTFLEI